MLAQFLLDNSSAPLHLNRRNERRSRRPEPRVARDGNFCRRERHCPGPSGASAIVKSFGDLVCEYCLGLCEFGFRFASDKAIGSIAGHLIARHGNHTSGCATSALRLDRRVACPYVGWGGAGVCFDVGWFGARARGTLREYLPNPFSHGIVQDVSNFLI